MNIGRVLARATIGALFVGHGTQKLFELAKRAAAQEQVEPSGRFQRSQEGVEQQAPVQDPA